jgi:hypothetical protein
MAILFTSNYKISKEKLKMTTGILASDPKVFKDEFNQDNVMMSLQLEGEEVSVRVPGKLLNQADPRILELKKGDRIRFFEKKNVYFSPGDKVRRLAFGLGDETQFFYSEEKAIAFYKSPKKLVFAGFFVIMAAIVLYFLLKN